MPENCRKISRYQRIPIILEANKHTGLDIMFEIDNVIRGHIYDPLGQPMKGVCLDLVPADGTKGAYLADCTVPKGTAPSKSMRFHRVAMSS